MVNAQRRNKAVKTLHTCVRRGVWKKVWRAVRVHRHPTRDPTAATTTTTTTTTAPVVKSRGRSAKVKRGSGGGHNKSMTPKANPIKARSRREQRLAKERLATFGFQSPPPFVPRKVGRKRKVSDGSTVFVGQKRHTLVNALTLNIWKGVQGRCSCCYARAPPAPSNAKSRRKRYMGDGKPIPRTNFVCDVCEVRLCEYCHFNEYPPHINKGSKPRSIIYNTASL